MTFKVQGIIDIDAEGAVRGISLADRSLDDLGDRADAVRAQLAGMTNQTGRELPRANALAAGSVSNLTAQFNDLGVMMAAGQNPIQLALQQGTQITQVIGPMGAAGAVKSLGAAMLQLVSPVNLVTLGVIAGGAALFQWATSAGDAADEAGSLASRMDGMKESAAELAEELRGLRLGVDADELALLDSIAIKNAEIAAAQDQVDQATNNRTRRNRNAVLSALEDERSALLDQLDTLRSQQDERETLTRLTAETADQERLLGEQMLFTSDQLRQNERLTELLRSGVEAATIQAAQFAGVDLSKPVLEAYDVAVLLKLDLTEAQLQAIGISETDMAGAIGAAADEAGRLAANLAAAGPGFARAQAEADAQSGSLPPWALGDIEDPGEAAYQRAMGIRRRLNSSRTASGSGGGGRSSSAAAAREERDAVQELIQSLQEELDLQRETDPVLQEMIRHRETLAEATDAERQTVEDLITTREREAQALENSTELVDDMNHAIYRAIDGSQSLIETLADMALRAAILGDGPLAGLLGFGGGGIVDVFAGAIGVPGFSKGGMIYGRGGPTEDRQLIAASPGEMVINAAAASANRPLLESINSGASVGSGNSSMHVSFDLTGANGDQAIEEAVARGIQYALKQYDREQLPRSISRFQRNPRKVG